MNRLADIDPLETLAALGVEGVSEVQPISGGMDTLIWRVDTSSAVYALRLFRPDQRDQWSKEVEVMRAVGMLGVPIPRIIANGIWRERPAILMEWCQGRPLLQEALAHPELIEPLGTSMGRLHARLHAVPLAAEYWDDHQGWLGMAGPDEVELQARLRQVGLQNGHVLHLDFHPLNILSDGGEATTILDWANTLVGDPRADVARTRSILRYVSAPSAVSSPTFYATRAAIERAWIDGYTRAAGSLPDMLLFDIWAGVVFIRDLEQYLGRPDFWMEVADFDRVRDKISQLKRQAGLSR